MPIKSKKPKAKDAIKIKEDMSVLLQIERKRANDEAGETLSLTSYIEEVLENDYLHIQMPVHKGNYYLLTDDAPMLMYFFSNSSMYSVTVKYCSHFKRDNLLYAKVKILTDVKPGQRRACFRLPCSLPVTVSCPSNKKCPPIEAEMIDFSDGGMMLATSEDIEIGEKITLSFDIGAVETVRAEVLRSVKYKHENYRYRISVKYISMCKKQKDRFFKFITEEQRKRIKEKAEQDNLAELQALRNETP